MNKRITSLLCFGLSLTLVSCGKNSNNQNNEPKAPVITNIAEAYEAFGLNNGTVLAGGYSITEFYNGKATYVQYIEDYAEYGDLGYIVNGTQGIYEFSLANGSFEYGDIVYSVANEDLINNAFYNLVDLQELGADVWTLQDDGSYTTDDIDTLDMFGYLNGNSYQYGDYMKNVKLTIEDNTVKFYAYMDFSVEYETDAYNADCIVEISKVGATNRKEIVNAIKNPVEQLGLSAGYDADCKAAMLDLAGKEIPAFGWSKESAWTTENGPLSLVDLSLGNKVSDFAALLLADGWVDMDSNYKYSGMDDEWNYIEWKDGDADWYEMSVYGYAVEENGVTTVYIAQIEYYTENYLNDVYWTTEYTGLYPNGVFSVTFGKEVTYPYSYVEADLATLEFPDNFKMPSLGFTSQPTTCTIANNDEYAAWSGCAYYNRSYTGSFADAATALAQLTIAENALLAAGFTCYSTEDAGTYNVASNEDHMGMCVYQKVFSDETALEVQFEISLETFRMNILY